MEIGPPFSGGAIGGIYNSLRSAPSTATMLIAASPTYNFQGGPPRALVVIGAPLAHTLEVQGSQVSGKSFGLYISSGTTSADRAVFIRNAAGSVQFMQIAGDGSGFLGWNGTAQTLTWRAAGNIVANAPSSGNTLLINGLDGNAEIALNSASSASTLLFGWGVAITGSAFGIAAQSTDPLQIVTATGLLTLGTNGTSRATINSTGNIVVNAPSSGSILSVTGLDGTNSTVWDSSTAVNGHYHSYKTNGTVRGYIGMGATLFTGSALGDFGIAAAAGELCAAQNSGNTAAGVLPATYWERNNVNLTLVSQTAAQKAFNGTSNGALTLPVGTYEFECFLPLSGMSATSGSFGFALGGTATIVAVWWSIASKLGTASATPEATQTTYNLQSNANTALATASTATTGFAICRGFFTVSVTGTVIPQVSLGVAAAATVAAGAYFFCRLMSATSSSRTSFGPWT